MVSAEPIRGNTVLIYWVQIIFCVQFLKVVDFKNRQKIRLFKGTYIEKIIVLSTYKLIRWLVRFFYYDFFSFFQMNRVQPPCNMGTAPTNFHSVFWVYLWLLILMFWFTIRNPLSDETFNEEILHLQTHFGCESFEKKI